MPIRVQCNCGKALAVKDEFAGKAVKCPGCQATIRIPAGGAGSPSPAKPAAAKPASTKPPAAKPAPQAAAGFSGDLGDLFEEEGFQSLAGPSCPYCGKGIKPGAVLCTHCGTNLQTGQKIMGMAANQGEASSHGHQQLDEAVRAMQADREMQSRTMNVGMPWWFLLIMLVFVGGFTFALVSIVNAATAGEDAAGVAGAIKRYAANSRIVWGCIITGLVLQFITRLWLTILGFKESVGEGLTTLFIWPKFLGQLSSHPVIGLVYTLGFFTTLSGLGLAAAAKFGV